MLGNSLQHQRRLLQFAVPGLAELNFAVPVQQVIAVTGDLPITPLPLMPAYVAGICEWAEQMVAVIDLAQLLHPTDRPQEGALATLSLLLVQTLRGGQLHLLAWPVSTGAGVVEVPAQLPAGAPPDGIDTRAVYAVVRLNQVELVMLDLDRLPLN